MLLKNFTKFLGKHLCQSLFFNKVEGIKLFLDAIFNNLSNGESEVGYLILLSNKDNHIVSIGWSLACNFIKRRLWRR